MYYVVKIYSNNCSAILCKKLRASGADIYIYINRKKKKKKKKISWGQTGTFLFLFPLLSVFVSFTSLSLFRFFLLLFSLSFFLFFLSLPFFLSPFLVAIAKYRFSESPPDSVSRADQIADGSLVGIQSRGRCCRQQTGRGLFFVCFCFCEHLRKCMLGQRTCSVCCAMDAIRR